MNFVFSILKSMITSINILSNNKLLDWHEPLVCIIFLCELLAKLTSKDINNTLPSCRIACVHIYPFVCKRILKTYILLYFIFNI